MNRMMLMLSMIAFLGLTIPGLSGEARIGIYGPGAENLQRVLARMGVESRIVVYGEEIDYKNFGVVMTTPAANRDNPALFVKTKEAFKKFVQDGGALLVLHPHRLNWDDGWLPYAVKLGPDAAQTVKLTQPAHPILKGLKEDNLGGRNQASGGVGAWCGMTQLDPHWEAIATGDPVREGAVRTTVLAEAKYGKGLVIVSCFDPWFPDPDSLDASYRFKLQLLANLLEYALNRQGLGAGPNLAGFEKNLKGRQVCLKDTTLGNRKLANIAVDPAGKVMGIYYQQQGCLNASGYMVHYGNSNGPAGVRTANPRLDKLSVRHNLEIEIPTSLINETDTQTAYTAVLTTDGRLRIATATMLSEQGKYVVQEFRISNIGGEAVTNARLCYFAQFMVGLSMDAAAMDLRLRYDKTKDALCSFYERTVTNRIFCGLAGGQASAGHTIDTKASWGTVEALPGLLSGEINNKDGGYQAGFLVWNLGEIKKGETKSGVVIIAVGDSSDDLNAEIDGAKAWYNAQGRALADKTDGKELLARLDRLNWRELTHRYVRDVVNRKDFDEDGWSNEIEAAQGTDPKKKDTDGDELIDPVDPHPLTPEPPLAITADELARDKPIIGKQREIIRDIRVGRVRYFQNGNEEALGRYIALLKYLGANSMSLHPTSSRGGSAQLLCWWKSEKFPRALSDEDYAQGDPLAKIIAACHKHDIRVNLYPAEAGMGDFYNDDLSQKKNGWCSNWTRDVQVIRHQELAGYPADLYLINGEEYGFQTYTAGDVSWGIHDLPCYCEQCQARYRRELGREMPDLAHKGAKLTEQPGKERLAFLRWRQKCFAELYRDCARAIKQKNPDACTMYMGWCNRMGDYNYTRANSWERMGHEGECDYVSVDYYRPRCKQAKSFNHLEFPIAMKQLIGAGSKRLGLIEQGEPASSWEPIHTYGPQISNIAQGGKGTQFFALGTLLLGAGYQNYDGEGMPVELHKTCSSDHFSHLKTAFDTLAAINDWVIDAWPPKDMALVYCGQGDEVYDFVPELRGYTLGSPKAVQHLFMTYLLRSAYPFDLYYLNYITYDQLKDYKLIVLPAPFACSEPEARVLERLAAQGCNILIIGDYGQVSGDGDLRKRGALLDLAGIETLNPTNTVVGGLSFKDDSPIKAGLNSVKVYAGLTPRKGTQALSMVNACDAGLYLRRVGKGQVVFMAGDFGSRSVSPPMWSSRPAGQFKITDDGSKLMNGVLDYLLGNRKSLVHYRVLENAEADVEVTLLENNPADKVLFAINWEFDAPVTVQVGVRLPEGRYQVMERDLEQTKPFELKGKKVFTPQDLAALNIELKPQGVRIFHIVPAKEGK